MTSSISEETIDIYSDYEPRPWQMRFESEIGDRKRAFLLWARRHGKDIACWNYLILKALQVPGSYYYVYPAQNQARKAIWEGMTSSGKKFIDYIPKEFIDGQPNSTEMRIKLLNGSIIRIMGSDNHDSLRGSNPVGVVMSEYAYHHPLTWQSIVEPILQENGGWALFNTTPFGKNHAWELWNYAKAHPELWYTEKITIEDSHLFPISELDEMRKRGVSEESIEQEYRCSFERGVEGSYYGRILANLRSKGKIRSVEYDENTLVYTAWDIGFGDSTAIFWFQVSGNEIHVLDYYENHGEGLAHYIRILAQRKEKYRYLYGSHFVPHDAAAGSFEIGMSRVKYAREMGIEMTVLPREGIDMGIERVRRWLPKCYFDETKCEFGLRMLEGYRKTYNEKTKVYSDTPLHSAESNGADAFRYLCKAVEDHCSNTGMPLEDYRKRKRDIGLYGDVQNYSILGN